MGLKDFFKTVLMSLNPAAYEKLAETKMTTAINYFISMVAAVFIVMCLLFIPALVMMPGSIEDALGNFKTLDIRINQSMKGPIYIPASGTKITIDTSKEYNDVENGNIIITEGAILYKFLPFTTPQMIVREGSFLENKDQIATFIMVLIVAMLPMILVACFLFHLIKYAIVILLALLIGFLVARIARFGITFAETSKVALFASTVMVIADLLTKPFLPTIYFVQYGLFLLFFIIGIGRVGDFESVVRPKKFKRSTYEE
ncbi:hypothetical protein COV19_02280 [Candidatus Woesearchaeota archaeon CG10_big_fil_rev_8_21_14_0_10_44_13]|nr:MAG: hypothetical protein COV19_02280 [Candidatus Woesearchaeota archaeon CG10_big_fil_rev_8_21_14_0_10_44_13]